MIYKAPAPLKGKLWRDKLLVIESYFYGNSKSFTIMKLIHRYSDITILTNKIKSKSQGHEF